MQKRNRSKCCGMIVLVLLLLPLFFSGCTKIGSMVPQDNRIALAGEGETVSGIYDDGILRVGYRYRLKGSALDLDGRIGFVLPAESLDVYTLFVNGQGEVIDQKVVYSSGYAVSLVGRKGSFFETSLEVPPEARGLSFSYAYTPHRGHK